jgi:guanylate kinase
VATRRGNLIVIAGPSGVGKGSVVQELLARARSEDPATATPSLALSVSATTRPPRAAEREGKDYFFVSSARFDQLVDEGALLEWASVFDHFYGTPAAFVEEQRDAGRDVLLEIDVQGARQVRERVPDAILILLEPPSMQELGRRLRGRGTESPAKIERRLVEAFRELDQRDIFDHTVVNDDLERASSQVAAIIEASRHRAGDHPNDQKDPPA